MPSPISTDLKQRMVAWHHDGMTYREIASLADCSVGLVSQVINNQLSFGSVNNPHTSRRGRKKILEGDDLQFIKGFYKANRAGYLDELQDKLRCVRGVDVSLATLSRTLRDLALSRKKVNRAALERDERLRTLWELDMAQYTDPEMFVALDESHVDNRTMQRTYGRSLLGLPCVQRETFLRGTKYSILPALWSRGIIALDIVEGSITREVFMKFLREQVAPQLNPFPQKRSIVIMDNCSIHHDEEIRALIEDECGARLIFLPPYSPDFNPIEEAFSAIKAWLRRHQAQFTSPARLPWMIHEACMAVSASDALGWFKDCGYVDE